ncbi:MAG: type I methionyl aminopeptidase [Patescibacteria group bacterium]|jgi:methionyl aminopeptidase
MIRIKNAEDIAKLIEGGKRLAHVVHQVASAVRPGISTATLDELTEHLIAESGGQPSFKGYNDYPASACISINEGVVHGIPSTKRKIKEGDVVGVDIGLEYQGLFTDMAVTVGVGKVSPEAKKLIEVTKKSLDRAIALVKPGVALGDIGHTVQQYAESFGFSVVKSLVGHGVGYAVHEEPKIPNFGKPGRGLRLSAGMVIAIEPMVNIGGDGVITLSDGWTIVTSDGAYSAHFEHTIAVTETGHRILTQE